MAGIWQGHKFWSRKLKSENQPPRTVRPGGRRGCLGSRKDPYPGTYHIDNCQEGNNKGFSDKLKNQRY